MLCPHVPSTSTASHIVIAPVVLLDLHLMPGNLQEDAIGVAVLVIGW